MITGSRAARRQKAHSSAIRRADALDDVFLLSEDYSWGNLHYLVGQDMAHTYDSAFLYFYNLLPHLFQ